MVYPPGNMWERGGKKYNFTTVPRLFTGTENLACPINVSAQEMTHFLRLHVWRGEIDGVKE